MIKAVIFDFDGVILESEDIKTEAFRELFRDHPDEIDTIIDYHIRNSGISRYVKVRYVYEHILGKELSLEKEKELWERFSRLVLNEVLKAPFVPGAKEFLTSNKGAYTLFIASGTPDTELEMTVRERKIKKYFKEIYGSSKKKPDIINGIIKQYDFSVNEIVFVGDAESDRIAAEETGVFFIERGEGCGEYTIKDLTRLGEVLGDVSSCHPRENGDPE